MSGLSRKHILRLLHDGKIVGRKIGPMWVTTIEAVEAYLRTDPKPGPKPGSPAH